MSDPRPVVVGIDGTPESRVALYWAAAEARSRGRPIRLVHAVDLAMAPALAYARADAVEGILAYGREVATDARREAELLGSALGVAADVDTGDAGDILVAESRNAALLVVGSRHLGTWRSMLGSVGCAVAARAACPVVVVRGHGLDDPDGERDGHLDSDLDGSPIAVEDGRTEPSGLVVVGVDSSELGRAALSFAADYAARHGCRVLAVHAWQRLILGGYGMVELDPEGESVEAWLQGVVAPLTRAYPQVPVDQVSPAEHPVDAIVGRARNAELVVVGARGRRARAASLLGSVSQGVLHHADCPVAVVHDEP